jgi:nucleoside phosphorylase
MQPVSQTRQALVLTALPVEYAAVRVHLNCPSERVHPQGTIYECGRFAGPNGAQWDLAIAQIGAGNAHAAMEAERAIAFFSPQVALFIGIAGGLKDVSVGDVIAATKVYGYESGKATADGFQARPDVGNSSYRMQQRARAEARKDDWRKRLPMKVENNWQVFIGPIAAGEKVVAATRSPILEFLRSSYSDALAVEMEGRGFLDAAHANHPIESLVIRGISDLIDGKASADASGSQQVAARNATAFAFEVLSKFDAQPVSKKWILVLTGTINDIDVPMSKAILEHLRKISGDAELTLHKIEPGSVKLFLESSPEGFERIRFLVETGRLVALHDLKIQEIGLLDDQTSEAAGDRADSKTPPFQRPDDSTGRPAGFPRAIANLAPSAPPLVIGREDAMRQLKSQLGVGTRQEERRVQVLTAVRGWPGIGKTTLAAALANDTETLAAFPEGGPLWASLGQNPDLFSELDSWARSLGVNDFSKENSLEKASRRLAAALRDRQLLLIIDDVWDLAHAKPLMVGGRNCTTLITTRKTKVAEALARPGDIYVLGQLTDESSLELLGLLAPDVVEHHRAECLSLVQELEGLPLAINVAGRMLYRHAHRGWDVRDLLDELRTGRAILEEDVPPELVDLVNETTPTVAALLKKSTDLLDDETRERFALLGVVKEKPATFDLRFLAAQWQTKDPKSTSDVLVDSGLLEPVSNRRFTLHALLLALAYSMLEK